MNIAFINSYLYQAYDFRTSNKCIDIMRVGILIKLSLLFIHLIQHFHQSSFNDKNNFKKFNSS